MNTNTKIEIIPTEEKLYDYLLVINPDGQVAADVEKFKQQIAHELGVNNGLQSPAHISLFRSEFPERYQDDFVAILEMIALKQGPFAVYTARFDHFNHANTKHTIYVNVANPKPLTELHKRVLQAFELKPHTFKPHITLARAISTPEFEKVYQRFDSQLFVRSFSCKSFRLMRRPASGGAYELVREFIFGDMDHMEGSLFNHAA
jgi:2'-5' RNA ligase